MQKYRFTLMAGLAALAIASTASAQTNTIIRITGSTAFRTVTLNAIKSMITPGSLKYGFGGTTFGSSSFAEFVGALASSPNVTVDVKTVWSGSVDGLQRVIFQGNPAFENNNWLASSSLSSTGTPNLAAGTEVAYADAAFCDNFQNSTIFQNPQANNDTIVGVVPFEWCRNAGAPTTMSNMTSLLAQQILSAGALTLKCWTGNPSDDSTLVYVVGRNYDSGTRVDTYSETGFGVGSPPNQSIVRIGASNVITNVAPYPAETVDGLPFTLGQSGYSSGGLVSGALNATGSDSAPNTGNKGWIVGYLGVADALNVTNGTAGPMTWNGVPYSPANVNNGQYTFWSYEHVVNNNNLSANQVTALNALINTIESEDPTAFGGISLSSMTVGRSVEGAPVSDGRAF
jgi:hypothetical protein